MNTVTVDINDLSDLYRLYEDAAGVHGSDVFAVIQQEFPDYRALSCLHAFADRVAAGMDDALHTLGPVEVVLTGSELIHPALRLALQHAFEDGEGVERVVYRAA